MLQLINKKTVSLLLLAGGRGERMGGQDKGLLTLRSSTFIERLLKRFSPHFNETLISANRNLDEYQRIAALWRARVLEDESDDFVGPLAGILQGLKASCSDWLLVLPCDAQALPDNLLARFHQCSEQAGVRAVFASACGSDQPVVCLLQRNLLPQLEAAFDAGERSVIRWLQSVNAARCEFGDELPAAGWSVNEPADLEAVAQLV